MSATPVKRLGCFLPGLTLQRYFPAEKAELPPACQDTPVPGGLRPPGSPLLDPRRSAPRHCGAAAPLAAGLRGQGTRTPNVRRAEAQL